MALNMTDGGKMTPSTARADSHLNLRKKANLESSMKVYSSTESNKERVNFIIRTKISTKAKLLTTKSKAEVS